MEEIRNEIVEVGPIIESDKLVEIAQASEKRIEAIKKIKKMALRVTNEYDWTDQGGRPYLQVSGSEKIARLFGISWRFIGENPIVRKDEPDGHFAYEVSMEFILKDSSIEFRGSRSSKDPFFSKRHGKDVPPSEIDKADVMKAAITNTIGNGITRILGIRNLTWEDLKEAGLDISKITTVEYKQKETTLKQTTAPATEKQIVAIQTLLSKIGLKEDYERHEKVSQILGFVEVIDSINELTMWEAGEVIKKLQEEIRNESNK